MIQDSGHREGVHEKAMKPVRTARAFAGKGGFSLIELMVVLALIGITASVAAVSLSSNDAKLRSFARDFRFNIEKAKQEALARNQPVSVAFFNTTPGFDCNDDGQVNEKDRCYVLYVDRDGTEGFNHLADEEIKAQAIPSSLFLASATRLQFSPFGGSLSAGMDLKSAIRTDYRRCASQCLTVSYPVSINHVARTQIGQKVETCVDCSLCNSCP